MSFLVGYCSFRLLCWKLNNLPWGQPWFLRKLSNWRDPSHWARNLHRLIQSWGLTLMIQTTTVMTPCKFRGSVVMTPWPVLLLSSWLRFIFEKTNASMLCSGLPFGEQWTYELKAFWQMFKHVNPQHPIYDHPERLQWTVPFMYHGDEGRGKLRRAILVTSYQPLLASKGHSFKSRMLCSVFPGERYACNDGEESLESLHAVVGADMRSLFDDGLEATVTIQLCLQCALA